MAQYPIPQFIEAEGRIISFLTFRQFFVLVGGGGIIFLLYYTVHPLFFFIITALPVGIIAGSIAFLKIDGVSIVTIVLNSMSFFVASKDYVWKKQEAPYSFKIDNTKREQMQNIQEFEALKSQSIGLHDAKKIIEYRKKI